MKEFMHSYIKNNINASSFIQGERNVKCYTLSKIYQLHENGILPS